MNPFQNHSQKYCIDPWEDVTAARTNQAEAKGKYKVYEIEQKGK